MKDDIRGTRHDYETELIEDDKAGKHPDNCPGVPVCGDCLDEQAEITRDEAIGG